MNGKVKNTFKYLAFVSIGALLMYLAFRGNDFRKMFDDILSANYWWVLFSLFFALVAFASRAYRWVILIEPLGHKPKFSSTFYSLMVGYFANMAIPRIGEVTRCTALYEVEKTPFTSTFGTVVTERIVDVITLFLLLISTLLWKFTEISHFFYEKVFLPIWEKVSGTGRQQVLMMIVGGFFLLLVFLLFALWKKISKISLFQKIKKFASEIITGLKTVFNLKRKGAFLFHSVLIWVLYFCSTYFAFRAVPQTEHLGIMVGLFILVIGGFGMSAPTPGGFGSFHILVASALTLDAVTGSGITYEEGIVYATILHTSQVLLVMLLGTLSLIMLNIAKRKLMQNAAA